MYCTVCGNENPDSARFCTACGHPQQTRSASQDVYGEEGDSQVPPVPPFSPFSPGDATGQQFIPPYAPIARENIPNYLPQAILVTICCCLPAGIVSIVFAAQVNGKIGRGDMVGARSASNNAKTWAWVAFGLGIASGALSLILGVGGV